MRRSVKTFISVILFLAVIPALAGLAVTALWNGIVTGVCGFGAICFWQGVGLFVLGQILTGGFVLALFLAGAVVHAVGHHRGDWHSHWHSMTDSERREFIERRRREHFGFSNKPRAEEDATD